MSVEQGKKLLQGFKSKIKDGFSRHRREGFSGILGSNSDMDSVLASDQLKTNTVKTDFTRNITTYSDDYNKLQEKTTFYLNNSENDYNQQKNYNVFINKSLTQDKITEVSAKGCVTFGSLANNGLTQDTAFNQFYPTNFTNYVDADNACKLWAADSGSIAYGVTQDSAANFNCFKGDNVDLAKTTQYSKPKKLYSVLDGDTQAQQGGLFKNGQIGTWIGEVVNPLWNIPSMSKPTLLKLFNSSDYSGRPAGVANVVSQNWWGNPWEYLNGGGWGVNIWPNKHAWWISTENYGIVGTMGYFYYVYDSNSTSQIYIYTIQDDSIVLKLNGVIVNPLWNDTLWGNLYVARLKVGKNVFEVQLINTGGPGAFALYVAKTTRWWKNVLFTSGPGWGYTSTPVNSSNTITNIQVDPSHPTGMQSVNDVPPDYAKCDAYYGGGVNVSSIIASYGRNCSNITNPPLPLRYVIIRPNDRGECIQIAQIVVNALVNGQIVNVARGKETRVSSTYDGGSSKEMANEGTQAPYPFPGIYHSECRADDYFLLDLGTEYQAVQIAYYNRSDCCSDRANGMKIDLYNGNVSHLGQKILTGALIQKFNVSTNGIS
jgi:hypothetical protein